MSNFPRIRVCTPQWNYDRQLIFVVRSPTPLHHILALPAPNERTIVAIAAPIERHVFRERFKHVITFIRQFLNPLVTPHQDKS